MDCDDACQGGVVSQNNETDGAAFTVELKFELLIIPDTLTVHCWKDYDHAYWDSVSTLQQGKRGGGGVFTVKLEGELLISSDKSTGCYCC